ncbi:hypothetical protein K443DRAFT_683219 [Laccaria amethystina LaAM-08-1]|uniref:Uncharacterized protein n=1 Tax=Laccaria amethystina LaAM-08-1 TaxID=1095629 RepID=A0A0C9XGC0_9AGAR|nr:hypothetical protein K443DRAFT_683219 [Laccaria amethystina LaAM-08-1]
MVPRWFLIEKEDIPDRVRRVMEQREPYRRSIKLAFDWRQKFPMIWLPSTTVQNRRYRDRWLVVLEGGRGQLLTKI